MKYACIIFLTCLLVPAAFAQEEPRLQIGVGLECEFQTGAYDSDGTIYEASTVWNTYDIPLTVYYEIITGLQLGLKAGFKLETENTDIPYGLDQAALSIQYTFDFGLGAYVDMYLPFGSEDVVGSVPELYFNFALFYYKEFDNFFISSEAVYTLTFAGDDDTKNDIFKITLQPGYILNDLFSVTLGMEFDYAFDLVVGGKTQDDTSTYVMILSPGVNYNVLDFLTVSLAVPVSLFGAGSAAEEPGGRPLVEQKSYWGITVTANISLL